MTELFIGLVLGALVGIVAVSAIAIPEIDRLRETIGKMEIDCSYGNCTAYSNVKYSQKKDLRYWVRETLCDPNIIYYAAYGKVRIPEGFETEEEFQDWVESLVVETPKYTLRDGRVYIKQ